MQDALRHQEGFIWIGLHEPENDAMTRLTAWAAIVAVPTMIGGIYGMNVGFMPELEWPLGYPLVMGLTIAVSGFLFMRFKRPCLEPRPRRQVAPAGEITRCSARYSSPDVPRCSSWRARSLPSPSKPPPRSRRPKRLRPSNGGC
jgi:hypothetical protein